VNSLAAAEMGKIESRTITSDDMLVTEFWEKSYLPYCETWLVGLAERKVA
jgi:hypothetical protein